MSIGIIERVDDLDELGGALITFLRLGSIFPKSTCLASGSGVDSSGEGREPPGQLDLAATIWRESARQPDREAPAPRAASSTSINPPKMRPANVRQVAGGKVMAVNL
ncbi:hypothetical protein CO665_17505 [Rhizobium anhuiense]|nr:hypothetical protein AS890_07295 [Rhizobium anhuiense bv. trifolii]PDS36805.1 hypothetical protein CO665_17505 [Rhizobium anhuiense]